MLLAQVGEPVPGEHALAADDQALAEGGESVEEGIGAGGQVLLEAGLTLGVQDVDVHGPCVQIDAAVESVRLLIGWLLVKAHHGLLAMGVGA